MRAKIINGDLPLIEGESSDIRSDAIKLVGESWLREPNGMLGGKTPNDMIKSGYAYIVRNLLRNIQYTGSS